MAHPQVPEVTTPWQSGTDLRSAEGLYRWPQAIFDGEPSFYPSVTTILDTMSGGMRHAEAWFAAQEVERVAQAACAREMVRVWCDKAVDQQTGLVGAMVDASPTLLLANRLPEELFGKDFGIHYFKAAGAREMTKRANRGSVVHDAIELWALGTPLDSGTVRELTETLISARGYAVTADYCVEYVESALAWCEAHVKDVHMAEAVVMNDAYSYAGTADLAAELKGLDLPAGTEHGVWLLDFKASKQDQPTHELQMAAYANAETVGVRGTDQRVEMPKLCAVANVYIQPGKATMRHWNRVKPKHAKGPKCPAFDGFLCARKLWQVMYAPQHPVTIKTPKAATPTKKAMNLPTKNTRAKKTTTATAEAAA